MLSPAWTAGQPTYADDAAFAGQGRDTDFHSVEDESTFLTYAYAGRNIAQGGVRHEVPSPFSSILPYTLSAVPGETPLVVVDGFRQAFSLLQQHSTPVRDPTGPTRDNPAPVAWPETRDPLFDSASTRRPHEAAGSSPGSTPRILTQTRRSESTSALRPIQPSARHLDPHATTSEQARHLLDCFFPPTTAGEPRGRRAKTAQADARKRAAKATSLPPRPARIAIANHGPTMSPCL